jgi:hypothetical protein
MKTTLLLSFLVLGATAFAASKPFHISILQDSVIEGKTVKAGDYKVSVENGNAIFKQGKQTFEVPAKEVSDPNKVQNTELTYKDNTDLQEIRIGGTNTKIVFDGAGSAQSGM